MDPPPGPQEFDLGSKLADSISRCQITDEDRDKFFRSETLIKSIFDRLSNGGGVGELVEDDHTPRNGGMEDDSKNQEVEEGDHGSNSGVLVEGDDAANIRNVEDGDDKRSEEVRDHDDMIDRKGEKVEDDDTKTKELVENVKHVDDTRGKEVEDDGMKSEEMKNNDKVDEEIEGGADTEGKEVDDYQTSSRETEKEDTIDKKIEETDAMEDKENEFDISKLNEEMENPNDMKEHVAEDRDGINTKGTENGGENDLAIENHSENGEDAEDHDSTINPGEISHDDQIQQEIKGIGDEQIHKEIERNGDQIQQEIVGNDDKAQQVNEGNGDRIQHEENQGDNAEAENGAVDDDLRLMDDDSFPRLSRDVKIGKKEFRRLHTEWERREEPIEESKSTSNSSIKRVLLDYLTEPCLKE